MAIDRRRRLGLQAVLAWAACWGPERAAWAAAPAGAPLSLALAWDELPGDGRSERTRCIGVWSVAGARAEVRARLVVPTRAHGITRLPTGELLSVARRPGLWMRRWTAEGALRHEAWAEPGRQFNGHVLPSADGRVLFSTEQSNEDGAGCVALRDPLTLALRDEWPSGGTDPHQLLRVGDTLFVANGGVPTRPETGRAKQSLPSMDSSLIAIDLRRGRRSGCWRLPDARLSMRHLAWHAPSRTLGIALQAEHDDADERARAPLLALFDGDRLRAVPLPAASPGAPSSAPLDASLGAPPNASPDASPSASTIAFPHLGAAGYAGDIVATADGFCVSAPKGGALLRWSAQAGWTAPQPLAGACALARATDVAAAWLAALGTDGLWSARTDAGVALPAGCQPDNHALVL
jgi:uncharacterized protein